MITLLSVKHSFRTMEATCLRSIPGQVASSMGIKVGFPFPFVFSPLKSQSLGVSGSITSLAPSPEGLASTSLDRFFRLHSTVPPDSKTDQKGQVLEKVYAKTTPTVVIWDPTHEENIPVAENDSEEGDEVWEGMQDVEDNSDDEGMSPKRSRRIK